MTQGDVGMTKEQARNCSSCSACFNMAQEDRGVMQRDMGMMVLIGLSFVRVSACRTASVSLQSLNILISVGKPVGEHKHKVVEERHDW